MDKKILVLGGTGAMGAYLVPKLLDRGFLVDVISLDDMKSDNKRLNYIKCKNGKDPEYIKEILKNRYDGIVDFMMYNTKEYTAAYKQLMENTEHYVFLSSYRVYADDKIITEETPRLLDVSSDKEYLATDDYSLYKAREENLIYDSGFKNWTIVRPAITYSKYKYQLTSCEANLTVQRAMEDKILLLPEEVKDKQATMTWGNDVSEMIARLVFNDEAVGQVYTTSTNEHNSWGYVADCYKELIGLKAVWIPMEDFIKVKSNGEICPGDDVWKLKYDRMYDRVVDNSKILKATGMSQSEIMPLYDGLKHELTVLPKDYRWEKQQKIWDLMDKYIAENNIKN